MATPARTVKKSLGKSFKNTLDLPFKLSWPTVSQETTSKILAELVRSLSGVKITTTSNKKKRKLGKEVEGENEEEDIVHTPKKLCPAAEDKAAGPEGDSQSCPASESGCLERRPPASESEDAGTKRSQLVVGVNEVTRALERGSLRAAVVCLSVGSMKLLHGHIQVLAATRDIPCIALDGVSDTIAHVLGLRSAMAIGLKKISHETASVDHFSSLAKLIADCAPRIDIPWLQATPREKELITKSQKQQLSKVDNQVTPTKDCHQPLDHDAVECVTPKRQPSVTYFPLAIKKTIITPKRRKK